MKVFIVTKEPFPNGMAATNRIKCYARALHDGGIECEVLICGCTETNPQNIYNTIPQGIYEGVPFRYIGGKTSDLRARFFRLFGQFSRFLKTKYYLRKNMQQGDVLFLYLGGKAKRMEGLIDIAKRKKAFCVRDLCELPYGSENETEEIVRLRSKLCESQFPRFDGIISISDALIDLAKQYALPTCKHIKVPIMVEYEHYYIKKNNKLNRQNYIFHAGTLLQQKDGILGMLEAFGIAKERLGFPIKYILTGNIEKSSHPKELLQIIEKYNLKEDVEFIGRLNREQIKNYLRDALLVISNRPKSQQDLYGFSTKLGEYLASGTTLIMTNWGEAVNWLENGKSAIIIEPEDTMALADAIVKALNDSDNSYKIGLAGQKVCQDSFDYRNWSKPLVDFMLQLGK